jgi:hypothetical protein
MARSQEEAAHAVRLSSASETLPQETSNQRRTEERRYVLQKRTRCVQNDNPGQTNIPNINGIFPALAKPTHGFELTGARTMPADGPQERLITRQKSDRMSKLVRNDNNTVGETSGTNNG